MHLPRTPSGLLRAYTMRVRTIMGLRGWTAYGLSKHLECGVGVTAPYLNGKALPPLYKVERIAAALGCTPHWLLFGDSPAPVPGIVGSDQELSLGFERVRPHPAAAAE